MFSFGVFMDRDEVEVHKNTKLTWSIKDLLYGIKNTEKMIVVLVYFRVLKRKPVIMAKVMFCFSFSLMLSDFSFSSSNPTEKSQKVFLLPRTIFCKRKLSCTRLDFGEIQVIAGTKRAIPSGQYRSPCHIINVATDGSCHILFK